MCSVTEHSLGQWYLELPVRPCSPDTGSEAKSTPWALLAFLLGAPRDPHGLGPEGTEVSTDTQKVRDSVCSPFPLMPSRISVEVRLFCAPETAPVTKTLDENK